MIQESYQQQQKSHNEKESESRQEKIAKEAIKIKTFVTYIETQLCSFTLFERWIVAHSWGVIVQCYYANTKVKQQTTLKSKTNFK